MVLYILGESTAELLVQRENVKEWGQIYFSLSSRPVGVSEWCENKSVPFFGNSKAGLQHIIEEHGSQFAQMGVSEAQIPGVVMKAVSEGKLVGYQGSGTENGDRFIFVSLVVPVE